MKNIYIIIGFIAVLINSLIGVIFKNYEIFNWLTADAVIILNILLLQILSYSKISDGFKIALNFIFPVLGFVSFILSIKLENKLENNILLVGMIILLSIQTILLIITNSLKPNK
jgi:hypothetical protein